MSNYNELVTILKELLFNRFYPKPEYIRGLLGDGRGNVLVPERPDYNYVRFSRSSTETFEVFNKEVSQPVDGWPVLIGTFPWTPGLVQVVATDWSAYAQTGWGDSVASIQAHAPTHEWPNFVPGSDAINVYLRAITPMRTQAAETGSASVLVTAYEYDGATGTGYQWPGLPPLSLGAATPPSGTMRYMGVYLNPATNTLGVVTGSTTIFTDAAEPARPVWPRGVYPSAYVRLYGGQTQISERDVRDARRLWNNTLIFTGTGGSGLPTPIITGSFLGSGAGSPTWTHISQLAAKDGSPSPAWETDNAGNLSNPGNGVLDLNGVADALVLDADGDTSISAPTNNQIDFETGGADRMTLTSSGLALASGVRLNEFSSDTTLSGLSNTAVPTENAVAVFVGTLDNAKVSLLRESDNGADALNAGATGNLTIAAGRTLQFGAGQTVNEFSTDGTLAGNSDTALPTEKAVKTYVDGEDAYAIWVETGETLVNGLNSDIAIAANTSHVSIFGPTGAFSIGGFTGGVAGRMLVVFNTTAQNMTFVNEDVSSTAGNRIRLSGVAAATTGVGIAMFIYTSGRWTLISIWG